MIYERNKYYDVEYWYIGFIHLQVDIFYCFCRDNFLRGIIDKFENDQKIDHNDSLPTIHIIEGAENKEYKNNWIRKSDFEVKVKYLLKGIDL